MENKFIIILIILIVIAVGIYFAAQNGSKNSADTLSEGLNQNQNNSTNYEIQGMKIEILKEGNGEATKTGDTVSVDYVGTFIEGNATTGRIFDSSIERGQPFQFTLGQNSVIQGWELGVIGMKVGEKRKLTIPPELAYGSSGAGGVIPPNATLIFEIGLLSINGK